jgi:hypothetical protein
MHKHDSVFSQGVSPVFFPNGSKHDLFLAFQMAQQIVGNPKHFTPPPPPPHLATKVEYLNPCPILIDIIGDVVSPKGLKPQSLK